MQARSTLALALSSLLLASCSSSSNSPRAVATPAAVNSDGSPVTAIITARFDPTNAVIPFPTNLLLSGTTDLTLNPPVANPTNFGDPAVALSAIDGFSTVAPWGTTFSTPPKPSTLVAGQTVRMFEVTLTGPGGGVTGVTRELGPSEFVVAVSTSDTTARTLGIVPLKPLKQLTSYMAVLLGDGGVGLPAGSRVPSIADAAGNDITADQTYFLTKRLSPLCVNGASTEPLLPAAQACALEPLRQLTNSQEAAAASKGIDRGHIALSWVATTESITPVLQAVLSRVETASAPPPKSVLAPSGLTLAAVGLPPIADIYFGTLDIPYYLTVPSATNPTATLTGFWKAAPGAYVPPFNAFGLSPASTNVTFANPLPVSNATLSIPVLMTVPNSASGKSKPATGWPIVIFQHGITRNRTDALAIAATFAAQGFAVVAIDIPLHGLSPTSPFAIGNTPFAAVSKERTFNLDLLNNNTQAPGPDGVVDPSGVTFINLSSLLTSRDNLRQAVSDLFNLARAIPAMKLSADSQGDFDASRVSFVGQSLGSIVGTDFIALDPRVQNAVLNVPGGGIPRLLDGSRTFGPQIRAGLAAAAGLQPNTPAYDQFFVVTQTVIDSADPINFAFATANKRILLQEVVGSTLTGSDQVIPNSVTGAPLSGTEPLIAALGLSTITATVQSASGIRGVVRFTAGEHGSLLSPTLSAATTAEMQREMASFIVSGGTTVQVTDTSVVRTQ
jgi:pimeloyl-ACP methyl ester carboxylesterase